MDAIDLGILGITIPQPSSFFGLPWVTGMIGIPNVPGPTVSQACATSARVLQMAADKVEQGSATCALAVTTDRCSNGATLVYPNQPDREVQTLTEAWVLDNFNNDPFAPRFSRKWE